MNRNDIQSLGATGIFAMPYPPELREAVIKAAASWKQFCSLDDDLKSRLTYSNASSGVGYELKDGSGNKGDRKENFDVALNGLEWLRSQSFVKAAPFIQDAIALVSLAEPLILDFARQAEESYGLKGFADEVKRNREHYYFRFIHYFSDRAEGDETATAHVDQSCFTFHLFENAAGLQHLTLSDKTWKPMPVSEGETVIIPAMQLQNRSQGKLTALAHRVVATAETAKEGRYSAVCFIRLADQPVYDKDRQGRLQEREPGFNYGMSHEEFAKLFA